MKKSELRQIYRARQKALSPAARASESARIALHFFESVDLSGIRSLHCFIPIERFNEVDTSLIVKALWNNLPEIRILAPSVNFESGEMESVAFASSDECRENKWGIQEPAGDIVDPEMIDMVLVPGLAFDRTGHRVGYGKGFYDRFLKSCRIDCVKIGLSYFRPLEVIQDIHDGDSSVGMCITPEGSFAANKRRSEDK